MFKSLIIGSILLIALQLILWFGQSGLLDFFELKQSIWAQVSENHLLLERNRVIAADVLDLKEGLESIEERARNEMGFIKDGEIFYQVGRHAGR